MSTNFRTPRTVSGRDLAVFALLLAITVCTVRLTTLRHWGVQVPFMDSYSEIGDYVYAAHGDFRNVFLNSLKPNNEHRIFFTHWLNVGLFLLNGKRWDPLAEAGCVAVLTGVIAGLIPLIFARGGSPAATVLTGVLVLGCFVPPFAYENILWGFQSQHYFFTIFSLGAIALLLRHPLLSRGGIVGAGCAVAACFSVGSGFFATCAVLALVALLAFQRRISARAALPVVLFCVAVTLAGLWVIPHVPNNDAYKVTNPQVLVRVFFRHLAWPNTTNYSFWLGPLSQLPLLWLLVGTFRRPPTADRNAYVIMAVGVWTTLISASLAHFRGTYTPYPRYFDYNCFHVIVCGLALLEIWRQQLFLGFPLPVYRGLVVGWTVAMLVGATHLADFVTGWALPHRKADLKAEQRAVIEYQETRDVGKLTDPKLNGMYPFTAGQVDYVAKELLKPQVRAFLPNEMLPVKDRTPHLPPVAWLRAGVLALATKLALASTLLLVAWSVRSLRSGRPRPRAARPDSTGSPIAAG